MQKKFLILFSLSITQLFAMEQPKRPRLSYEPKFTESVALPTTTMNPFADDDLPQDEEQYTPYIQHILEDIVHPSSHAKKFASRVNRWISSKFDLNTPIPTLEGRRLLHVACRCDSTAHLSKALLEAGANPNSITELGYTPLDYACRLNSSENLRVLLKYGADPNLARKKDNLTPLQLLKTNETPEKLRLAKVLEGEFRHRLFLRIESARRKNLTGPFERLPKDIVKEIIFLVYPKIAKG